MWDYYIYLLSKEETRFDAFTDDSILTTLYIHLKLWPAASYLFS